MWILGHFPYFSLNLMFKYGQSGVFWKHYSLFWRGSWLGTGGASCTLAHAQAVLHSNSQVHGFVISSRLKNFLDPSINSGWRNTERSGVMHARVPFSVPRDRLRMLIIIFADYISGRIKTASENLICLAQIAFQTHSVTRPQLHTIQYARLYLRDHEYHSLSLLDRLSLSVPCA